MVVNSIQLQPNPPTIHSHFPLSLPILKLLSMAPTPASFVLITQTFISFWLTKLFFIQSAQINRKGKLAKKYAFYTIKKSEQSAFG